MKATGLPAAMRLFVGMPVPPHPGLAEATAHLVQAVPGVRPVPAGSWHVTLRFLGEVRESAPVETALQAALAGVAATPGQVVGAGAFPSRRRARVVWAGVLAPGIEDVAGRVVEATSALGEPPDRRPFVAHVTLARLREPRDVDRFVAAHAADSFGPAPLAEVVLFASEIGPAGPRYRAVARFPLAPAQG
jgi:2'-5' RNA ligase